MRQVARTREHDETNGGAGVDGALVRILELVRRPRQVVEEGKQRLTESPERHTRQVAGLVILYADDAAPVAADTGLAAARRLAATRSERAWRGAPTRAKQADRAGRAHGVCGG